MKKLITAIVMSGLSWSACISNAQTKPSTAPATTRPAAALVVVEKSSVTEHELKIGDAALKYRATAGIMPLKDDNGKARANFFFVAYEKIGDSPVEKRPITFVFNGGPGAAAIWLHIGTAGPKRIDLSPQGDSLRPPYKLVDNESTWLTHTDMVLIDPVGTGYSRPAEGVKGEEFYGVNNDINSMGEFIRLYLTKSQRWASPKFLAGESYGTTRASLLADHLLSRHGIALNGVMLISMVLNFQTLSAAEGNDLTYAVFFPTYTAAAIYHKKLGAEKQADFDKTIAQVKKWVIDSYTPALMKGDSLTADERAQLAATMSEFTGLPTAYILRSNFRISPAAFMKQLLGEQRRVLGRFDSRITGEAQDQATNYPEHDPSLSHYVGVYAGTFNDYVRRRLKFESDLKYEYLAGLGPWDFGIGSRGGYLNVTQNLRSAMVENPHMKVLVASGWYDLATPFFAADHTISHLNVSEDLKKNIRQTYYDGGHMMYHHAESLRKLNKDVTDFIDWSTK